MTVLPNGVDLSKRKTFGQDGSPLSMEQIAQILFQAGFRGDALVYFTGIGYRESGGFPGTRGTESDPGALTGDFGLFGINSVNDTPAMRAAVGYTSRAQWTDPLVNAKLAFALSNGGSNLAPWRGSSQGYAAGGDPYFGVNMTAARTAVQNASNQGLLGQSFVGGAPVTDIAAQGSTPTGPFALPSDAKTYRINETGEVFAMFDLGGVKVAYQITAGSAVDYNAKPPEAIGQQAFIGIGAVNGGDATELAPISTMYGGSYKAFWDSIVGQVMGYTNPAKDDPEVRKVLAEFAARPDMAPQELQNRLEATTWWRTRSQGQIEWNGLSDGEKTKRRDEVAAQMAQAWAQYTGQPVGATDPQIQNYVEKVASGEMGMGAWTEAVVKKAALGIANSPYNRDIFNEQKAEKQPGIDVENTAMRIRQTLNKWGIQWSEGTIQDWAHKITGNDASDDDLLETLKDQAIAKYGQWKAGARDMETSTFAAPWTETASRVLERQVDLSDSKVQAALTKGQPVWEFEQDLKKSNEWLGTKNAQEQLTTMAGSVGKLMGFF